MLRVIRSLAVTDIFRQQHYFRKLTPVPKFKRMTESPKEKVRVLVLIIILSVSAIGCSNRTDAERNKIHKPTQQEIEVWRRSTVSYGFRVFAIGGLVDSEALTKTLERVVSTQGSDKDKGFIRLEPILDPPKPNQNLDFFFDLQVEDIWHILPNGKVDIWHNLPNGKMRHNGYALSLTVEGYEGIVRSGYASENEEKVLLYHNVAVCGDEWPEINEACQRLIAGFDKTILKKVRAAWAQ